MTESCFPRRKCTVYGTKELYGTVVSYSADYDRAKSEKTPDWNDILIDIGYGKEEAGKLVELGTPVGYRYSGDELLNGRITSRGFDDKSCAAAILTSVINTPAEEMLANAYVILSTGEENGRGGVSCAAHTINPDFALICDVNFAKQPGTPDGTSKLESGPMISVSSATSRRFTKHIIKLAKDNEIPYTTTIEPTSTGTNAECVAWRKRGNPHCRNRSCRSEESHLQRRGKPDRRGAHRTAHHKAAHDRAILMKGDAR